MKSIKKAPIIFGILSLVALFVFAKQEKVLQIFRNGEIIQEYNIDDIDYIEVNDRIITEDKVFYVNGVSFNMVFVQGGSFEMGAPGWETASPVHLVTLSDYFIGQTEVTQKLWYAVMGAEPFICDRWSSSYGLGDKYPAYNISYTDCQQFIAKLNSLTGQHFRMPTEAEWEYAARGGNKSKEYLFSGSNTLDEVGWFYDNSGGHAHEVATKSPNELGIYDMSGNVSEWCSDWYGLYSSDSQTNPTGPVTGFERVRRDGSWHAYAVYCEVIYRNKNKPEYINPCLGLRLAL